jgi:CubicO group peptidase (beta-lactamase class C family)
MMLASLAVLATTTYVLASVRPCVQRDTLPTAAVARIDSALGGRMRDDQVPGAAVVLLTRDGLSHILVRGMSDVAAGTPVTEHTLFEAGSLSKTITAMALLQMVEEDLIELDRPVTTYLPWYRPPSSFEPFTVHQLLTHTAGLVRDRDDIPSSPSAAAALAERAPGVRPGARFSYSNLGYQFLSLLMQEVDGRQFPDLVRRRVLEPAGMDSSAGAITNTLRERLARGYQYFHDDRPPHSAWPLVPATWSEHAAGDANVAMTPADLSALLTLLPQRGGKVLSAKSIERMFARAVRAPSLGASARYGYGVIIDSLDGREIWWNSGATQGFRAWFAVEPVSGAAAGVLMNGPGNARRMGEFALRTLRAVLEKSALPPVPSLSPPSFVSNAAEYAGEYTDVLGEAVRFEADGNTLQAASETGSAVLERMGSDRFYANLPRFALFPLQFGRDSTGAVTEVLYGGERFINRRARGPVRFDYPLEWLRYIGHYRAAIPWSNNFRVIVRKGVLLYVTPEGTEEVLVAEKAAGTFRIGADPAATERVEFDTVISNRAQRAMLSGVAYYRSFAP